MLSRDVQSGFGLAQLAGQFLVAELELRGVGFEFLVLGSQPGQFFGLGALVRPAGRSRERAVLGLLSPVHDMGVIQPFLTEQGTPLGAAFGQRVEGGQDPRL
ncbi:hypothetical protein, partial [Nonomuraea zeae]|uniref:hypothetical protein n=1 Tax=Nonomuraea zeae TaxID=1642303 RepID=UPI001478C4E9